MLLNNEMGETENLQDGCDCKKMVHVWYQISHFFDLVMKKYRVSTTNVPIFIEIRSGDKIRSIIIEKSQVFKRSNFQDGGKRGLGATGKASLYRSKPI